MMTFIEFLLLFKPHENDNKLTIEKNRYLNLSINVTYVLNTAMTLAVSIASSTVYILKYDFMI